MHPQLQRSSDDHLPGVRRHNAVCRQAFRYQNRRRTRDARLSSEIVQNSHVTRDLRKAVAPVRLQQAIDELLDHVVLVRVVGLAKLRRVVTRRPLREDAFVGVSLLGDAPAE